MVIWAKECVSTSKCCRHFDRCRLKAKGLQGF